MEGIQKKEQKTEKELTFQGRRRSNVIRPCKTNQQN